MSGEYKAMFDVWQNESHDFLNLLLDYDDEIMPWSEIYRRAHALFKEKVWLQRGFLDTEILWLQHGTLDNRSVKSYKRYCGFDGKFEAWLRAYPTKKKRSIIDEHEQNWSAIYKNFYEIFKDEVWIDHCDEILKKSLEEAKAKK